MNFLLETVLGPKNTVELVSDVVRGMQVLKNRNKVDVIILDIDNNTPEILEFIYHVKSSRLYSNSEILVIGTSSKIEANITELQSVTKIFPKPFSPELLVDYVTNLSEEKKINVA